MFAPAPIQTATETMDTLVQTTTLIVTTDIPVLTTTTITTIILPRKIPMADALADSVLAAAAEVVSAVEDVLQEGDAVVTKPIILL